MQGLRSIGDAYQMETGAATGFRKGGVRVTVLKRAAFARNVSPSF